MRRGFNNILTAAMSTSLQYRVASASENDVSQIVQITNEAFMADSFFKKPEYVLRFNHEIVSKMISQNNSAFLLALNTESDDVLGSIFLQWEVNVGESKIEASGKFSAVSVLNRMERRGIGRFLVSCAEGYLINQAMIICDRREMNYDQCQLSMGMGVVNVRHDLFPWYQKQGYEIVGEIRDDPDFDVIVRDDLDVYCILMKKYLEIISK